MSEDVMKFCRSNLPAYRVPKSVVFGPLPKTATGKVQKHVLQAKAKEMGPRNLGIINTILKAAFQVLLVQFPSESEHAVESLEAKGHRLQVAAFSVLVALHLLAILKERAEDMVGGGVSRLGNEAR
ncbi:hypothetical protein POM88_033235 [Heracleum sosnowskyi]|uniref:AMP-binding enzyme C-terminal domain-containing protein n=1 Tax=Heracleum sosnowskyi TaxID=360622 RepID=A0AAD8MLD7_9APIA|nr:hypothetical protein POM88_033235 [Heracleum sosnowskyi]